jgi:hypothetical protein
VLLVQEDSNLLFFFHILDIAMHVDPLPTSIDHSSQVPHVVIFFFGLKVCRPAQLFFLLVFNMFNCRKTFHFPGYSLPKGVKTVIPSGVNYHAFHLKCYLLPISFAHHIDYVSDTP